MKLLSVRATLAPSSVVHTRYFWFMFAFSLNWLPHFRLCIYAYAHIWVFFCFNYTFLFMLFFCRSATFFVLLLQLSICLCVWIVGAIETNAEKIRFFIFFGMQNICSNFFKQIVCLVSGVCILFVIYIYLIRKKIACNASK